MLKHILSLITIGMSIILSSCAKAPQNFDLKSPSNQISLSFNLTDSGQPEYSVNYQGKQVITPSTLGWTLKNAQLTDGFEVKQIDHSNVDETWQMPWGERKNIQNHYNQSTVTLSKGQREIHLIFRAFDDGVAFRYEIPAEAPQDSIFLMNEQSEFNISQNLDAWSIPADFDSYEHLYKKTKLSEVKNANTPITLASEDQKLFLSIHEAALTDFAGMTLYKSDKNSLGLYSTLVPWPDKVLVRAKGHLRSPWRTIQIASKAGDLITSDMILNLNEPSKIQDESWIKPMKYVGVWWGMHIGHNTWTMGKRHGATTESAIDYINFAAENNIQAVLFEGWNTGWDKWGQKDAFDHITPYADFDLEKVAQYCKEKGISLIMHNETGGDIPSYEALIEKAYAKYQQLGSNAVKTGYAGGIMPRGQFHHGQFMVRHYRKVVETAAKYHLMLDAHEPIKDTGIRRTWPNMMTREGVRGMEWNGWSAGNPPAHHLVLPFTRGLSGPIDYTPGIFDLKYEKYKNRIPWNGSQETLDNARIHTTLAKQLALFVTLYSPMQMASDLIENYKGNPAFQFISDVPCDWDETKILDAAIGEHMITARRNGNNWYIGGATDENARTLSLSFDFLEPGKNYTATIYADNKDTDLEKNPTSYKIEKMQVDASTKLSIPCAESGGFAMTIIPQ
ncbi:alpha-glucosidase (plasmid) [Persicobacter psychrovividus]|uniref:Alpha-glucosidase n=2 Tax=Persicobacter psychrovividus TaxID=387638 RepID=A0ABM7VKZ9_9BACT|nr:alpha-glucosidase [Persicobacter psychrovividus]